MTLIQTKLILTMLNYFPWFADGKGVGHSGVSSSLTTICIQVLDTLILHYELIGGKTKEISFLHLRPVSLLQFISLELTPSKTELPNLVISSLFKFCNFCPAAEKNSKTCSLFIDRTEALASTNCESSSSKISKQLQKGRAYILQISKHTAFDERHYKILNINYTPIHTN